MLFQPFRREIALLDANAFEEIYHSPLETIGAKKKEYDSKLDMDRLRHLCSEIIEQTHPKPPIMNGKERETDTEEADLLIGETLNARRT